MKHLNARLMFVLVLLSLPLFGWGCAGDSSTASVSDKSDTPQADTEKSAPGDETPSAKSSSKDDDTTPSAQSALPDGWKWYDGKTFKIGYPGEWYALTATIENPSPRDLERVFFDLAPMSGDVPEPIHPVMMEVWTGNLENALATYTPEEQKILRVGDRDVIRFSYTADFLGDARPVGYAFERDGRVYLLQRFAGDSSDLQNMIANMEVR